MQFFDEDERSPREKKFSLAPIIIVVVVFLAIVGIVIFRHATMVGKIAGVMGDEIGKEADGCNVEITAVIDHHADKESSSGPGVVYAPVYSFEYEGESYSVTGNVWQPDPFYEDGQEVQIMIDPSDPTHIYDPDNNIGTGMRSFLGDVLIFLAPVLLIPLLVIIIPAIFIIRNFRRAKQYTDMTRE